MLLNKGANINSHGIDGNTPLHTACLAGIITKQKRRRKHCQIKHEKSFVKTANARVPASEKKDAKSIFRAAFTQIKR